MTYAVQNWHQGAHTNLSISDIGGLRAMDDAILNSSALGFTPVNKAGDTSIGSLDIGGVSPFTPPNTHMLYVRNDWTGTEGTGNGNVIQVYSQAKGTWNTSHFVYANETRIQDHTSVNQVNVTNAANNGSGLIRITASSHGYSTGDRIGIDSVGGTTEANGSWIVTRIDANNFDLQGSTFTNAYTTGGIATNRTGYACFLALVAPSVTRGGLTGTLTHADDIAGFFTSNNGTAKATDPLYVGHNTTIAASGPEWDTSGSVDARTYTGLLINNADSYAFRGTTYHATQVPEVCVRRARGTFDAPLRAKNGDVLGRFSAWGAYAASDVATGVFPSETARIDMTANEDQTLTNRGSRIVFYTTPITSTTISEKFRVAPGDGIDFVSGSFSSYQIRLKNNVMVQGLNNAGAANVDMIKLNTSDQMELAGTVKLTGSSFAAYNGTPVTKPAVTGALSSVTDANAKAVLTSIIAALKGSPGVNLVTDSTT